MTEKIRETIASRIQKLLALSESPNENEATAAMEKAHLLLREYNLSMADVDGMGSRDNVDVGEEALYTDGKQRAWRQWIVSGVADLNYCSIYIHNSRAGAQSNGRSRNRYDHTTMIVGKPHNIAVSRDMITYLFETVVRLSAGYNGSIRDSYRKGLADTLYHRLRELRRAEETSSDPTCTDLVVTEKQAVERFLATKNLHNARSNWSDPNSAAYARGAIDGNSISLHRQVGGNTTKAISQ